MNRPEREHLSSIAAESSASLETPTATTTAPIILCIGVGGAGSNIVDYIHAHGIKDVELVVSNTDLQALAKSTTPKKLPLGPKLTRGLGAGANPVVAEKAAIESEEAIAKFFQGGIKMVFIAAGMGGGTGTGAAPVVAKLAKSRGIIVISVVTSPFKFEGRLKVSNGEQGIQNLKKHSDSVIIIENDKLINLNPTLGGKLDLKSAFAQANEVLYKAITSITDTINKPGEINVDFRDVDTILHNADHVVMGSATARGENRGKRAAEEALKSPLLRHQSIQGAQRVLFMIFSGTGEGGVDMQELLDIASYIEKSVGSSVEKLIWGHAYEEELGDKIKVNIIASKFNASHKEQTAPRTASGGYPPAPKHGYMSAAPSSFGETNGHKPHHPQATFPSATLEEKIQVWDKRAKTLLLEGGEDYQLTEREVKERLIVPAYKRKNWSLTYVPNSSTAPPRYHLYQDEPA